MASAVNVKQQRQSIIRSLLVAVTCTASSAEFVDAMRVKAAPVASFRSLRTEDEAELVSDIK
jgi:hypothetical protein